MKICQNCNFEYVGRANKYCSPECATAAHKAQVEARASASGACPVCLATDRNPVTGVCRPCNKAYAQQKRLDKAAAEGKTLRRRHPVDVDGTYTCYKCGSNDFHLTPTGKNYCRRCMSEYRRKYIERMTPKEKAKWLTQQRLWWSKKNCKIVSDGYKDDRSLSAPQWLTESQWDQISDIYEEAEAMTMVGGELDYHVDHIIPIRGQNVCGLHVPWNLQVLESKENKRKGNRYCGEDAW